MFTITVEEVYKLGTHVRLCKTCQKQLKLFKPEEKTHRSNIISKVDYIDPYRYVQPRDQ